MRNKISKINNTQNEKIKNIGGINGLQRQLEANYLPLTLHNDRTKDYLLLDKVYDIVKLKTLEDWLNVPHFSLRKYKIEYLYSTHYSKDFKNLLTQVYPNYPWHSSIKQKHRYMSNIEEQRDFMDKLYAKFQLTSLDDWFTITKHKIQKNRGVILISLYSHNMRRLLSAIYPNYPFDFEKLPQYTNNISMAKSMETQQNFLDQIFFKMKFQSLDDFLSIHHLKLRKLGGKQLIKIYKSFTNALSAIYPNYPWIFDKFIRESLGYFKSIENQRKFMEELFYKLKLVSLEDFYNLSTRILIKNGGKKLFKIYYGCNMKSLLKGIFPNYPWQYKEIYSSLYFNSLKNQKIFMDHLFEKLQLTNLSDWLNISKSQLSQNGAHSLLIHFGNDMKYLLASIYPNFPWYFGDAMFNSNNYFHSLENQGRFMIELFAKLGLNSPEKQISISKNKILENGGYSLLSYYSGDINNLFSALFPNHNLHRIRDIKKNLKSIIGFLQKKYLIGKKGDWYRLPHRVNGIDIKRSLQMYYPTEEWNNFAFVSRTKKVKQRIWLVEITKLFPQHLILEDYRKPNFKAKYENPVLELDVFIPALHIAYEYQGEHHFHDISVFAANDCYKIRDELKIALSQQHAIQLCQIPYWCKVSDLPSLTRTTFYSFK